MADSTTDSGSYNPLSDLFATARTYFDANAAAKQASNTWAQQPTLGVNQNGTPYIAGKASILPAMQSSTLLVVVGGALALGLLVLLLHKA